MAAPSRGTRAALLTSLLALTLGLTALSTPRHIGDSGEYLAMSLNLSRLAPPSLTPAELAEAQALLPLGAAAQLKMPRLQGRDGRQDFPHFWFYSLLAAPFVRIAQSAGMPPIVGFSALNLLLLLGVAVLLSTRVSPSVLLLVVAGPILWWIDKPHTEVFTVSLITTALVLLRSAPWWSIVAFGAAATQNPPAGGAMVAVIAFALHDRGWRAPRVWVASAVGVVLAGLHPLYYYSRLGIPSGLTDAVDRHWPTLREFTAVVVDPNLSVVLQDPLLLAAIAVAIVTVSRHLRQHAFDSADATVALIAGIFLFSFTQTTNFNSGGTPGPSRYGLWLIPFAVLIPDRWPAATRWIRVLSAGSVLWCVWAFAPALPEQHLRPSTLASAIWRFWPSIDNPLAEVFTERLAGQEGARPPVATPGCEKVLLIGNGTDAPWPARCTPEPAPDFCRRPDALCFANETRGAYRFISAPASPAWRAALALPESPLSVVADDILDVTPPVTPRAHVALWLDEGWSYAERLAAPAPDTRFREWRWIDRSAVIGISSAKPTSARLTISAQAFGRPRRLRVSAGGRELVTILVTTNTADYRTPEFALSAGRTSVRLDSLDGSEAPNSSDPRRLSIQFFRVQLVVTR